MPLQRQHAVVHVARLVLDHVAQQFLQQRFAGGLVHHAERAERESLDHDLHAEELHVPARVAHQRVHDREQVVVDLVQLAELGLQVAQEHLQVACLVHDLRRAVELAVHPAHALGHLR